MRILAVIVVAFVVGCGDSPKRAVSTCAPTPGEPPEQVATAPHGTPARVRLGPGGDVERTRATIAAGRRGKPLVVSGVVRGPDCRRLAGATVNAWQTNAAGKYGPGRTCCYLQGTVRTDRRGRYALDTVVPGSYGGRAHIHIEAGHEAAGGVLTELVIDGRPSRIKYDVVLPGR
jgi:protocatechuate 3,4-dioxygenase beta subunit